MPITLDLRQAIIHKTHGQSQATLREMIDNSVDGPETAMPGLGVLFEIIWKDLDPAKKDKVVGMLHDRLSAIAPGKLTNES